MSDVRLAIEPDAPVLEHISKTSMTSFWREDDFVDAIKSDNAMVYVAQWEADVVGYAVMYFAADEGEIPSIATHRDHRRRGIGAGLLARMIEDAGEKGIAKIFLEVRESNEAAHKLYEKCGFICAGSRRDFYDSPRENADIMVRVL